MWSVLIKSSGRGERFSPYLYRFKLGPIARSVATEQVSRYIPSLSLWVLTDMCGGVELQRGIRVRPAEFIKPKQPRFGHVKDRFCISLVWKKNISLIQEPHNSSLSQIQPALDLSSVGSLGFRRGWSVLRKVGRCGPHPRSQQGGATKSQEGGATGSPESGASRSPMRGRHHWGSQESGAMALTLKPHNSVTENPWSHAPQSLTPLSLPSTPGPGSWLLSRVKTLHSE